VVVDESEERRGEAGAIEDLVDAVCLICHRHNGAKRGMLMLEQFRKVIDSKKP
jgi:translation elongation factor EF-4